MLIDETEKLQNLIRRTMVQLSELNDVEKEISKVKNDTEEFLEKLEARQDAHR